jgi:hypothetical protein
MLHAAPRASVSAMRGFESSVLYRRLGGLTASVTAMLTFRAGQGKLASRPRCPWDP